MSYKDKNVIVTGAASGFGKELSIRLSALGANVLITDINETRLVETKSECSNNVLALKADVRCNDECEQLVQTAVQQFGTVDICFNNAGVLSHTPKLLHQISTDEFDQTFQVNMYGMFYCMKHQLAVMSKQRSGVILNTSSVAGQIGAGFLSDYSASKHAVIGLTKSAAESYARYNIRINAICPSFVKTPILDKVAKWLRCDQDQAIQKLTELAPMKRGGTIDEIVNAMIWLCSEENTYMTGQAVTFDGGLTAI